MRRIEHPALTTMPPAVSNFFITHSNHTPIHASAVRSVAIDTVDLRPVLPSIRIPMLLLTGDRDPSDAVLRHEAVHKRQWRRYGFLMPVLYLLAGRNPLRNRFEIEAGLEDGGYVPRARGTGQSEKRP